MNDEQKIREAIEHLRIYMAAATVKNPLLMIDDYLALRAAGKHQEPRA